MNVHKNARLTPAGRAVMIRRIEDEGLPVKRAAQAAGVSARTAHRWLDRHRRGGERRLHDRSSAPRRCPRKTPEALVREIERLRRARFTGPAIAQALGMARSTVGAVLRRLGLGRLANLDPKPAVIRYERSAPGEMIHLDIKKLGRFEQVGHRITGDRTRQSNSRGKRGGKPYGAGWEYVHVCIDDASRIAFSQIHPDEKKESALACLEAALAYEPFYIGALGSRRTHATRVARLQAAGIEETRIGQLRGPIGLYGPTRTSSALAISVLGEITQARMSLDG